LANDYYSLDRREVSAPSRTHAKAESEFNKMIEKAVQPWSSHCRPPITRLPRGAEGTHPSRPHRRRPRGQLRPDPALL